MQKSPHPGSLVFKSWSAAALTAAVVVFADQLLKKHFLSLGSDCRHTIITNVLELVRHENTGIVANIPLPLPLAIGVTAVIMAAIAIAISRSSHMIETVALAQIFGGALGNLIDRLTRGFVFDWILLFGQSAINIADIAIVEGALFFMGWKWFEKKHAPQSESDAEHDDAGNG
jgi:signal peptidase II